MRSPTKAGAALEEFISSFHELGPERLTQVLSINRKKAALRRSPDAQFVMRMVAQLFKIPTTEITDGVQRNTYRADAIGFCVYYLHYELGHPIKDVCWMLNRSQWVCYKHVLPIRRLDPAEPSDKKYVGWKHLMDQKIALHKSKTK